MSNLPPHDTIVPGNYNGYSQAGEIEEGTYPAFSRRQRSKCRIVALLGPDDYDGSASPSEDGFIVSDFFYLYHVFSQVTSAQQWLTCLPPDGLVDRYGSFEHGDFFLEDMLIVLDRKICNRLRRIKVYSFESLLDHFLATIQEESRLAVESKQELILILCGHGVKGTGDILIGSLTQPRSMYLTPQMISNNVVPGVNLTLVMPSCFGGHWVVSPELNATVFSAASPHTSGWSWHRTPNGDLPGTLFVSAFVASLMAVGEDEAANSVMTSGRTQFQGTKTLASLCADIHRRYAQSLIRFWLRGTGTFCIRNDAWQLPSSCLGISFISSRSDLGLTRVNRRPTSTGNTIR